jgi:tetratricopeptide (TPR) repeat protein
VQCLLAEPTLNINLPIRTGETALSLAACYFQIEIVRLLLGKGADTRSVDWKGDDAIKYATKRPTKPELTEEIVKLILDARKSQTSPDAEAAEKFHKERGNAAFQKGKYGDAIEEYTAALKINQLNPILWGNRAAAYLGLDQYEKALEDCHKATKLDENYVKAYYREATAFMYLGNLFKAREVAEKAVSLSPGDAAIRELQERIDDLLDQVASAHGYENLPASSIFELDQVRGFLSASSFQDAQVLISIFPCFRQLFSAATRMLSKDSRCG